MDIENIGGIKMNIAIDAGCLGITDRNLQVGVYHVAFEKYPEMYPDSQAKLHEQTKYLAKHATYIVTISQATKRDMREKYFLSAEKISVVYPGVRSLRHGKNSEKARGVLENRPY